MSRTNIDLDDDLIEKVMRMAGVKTKRDAVHTALEAYVETKSGNRGSLSRYAGKFEFAPGFDPVKSRRGREFPD